MAARNISEKKQNQLGTIPEFCLQVPAQLRGQSLRRNPEMLSAFKRTCESSTAAPAWPSSAWVPPAAPSRRFTGTLFST